MTEYIFEWDEAKAESNYKKHGIKFEDAVSVFNDPLSITTQDRFENDEYRWQVLGVSKKEQLLLVAHTYYDRSGKEIVRIISARKANKKERKQYGNR
ncbi:MAG: BrnT family toxin [Neisseriaceae bacterium]|nr:BrnT family toxin [Neisseriaceae bacterium]